MKMKMSRRERRELRRLADEIRGDDPVLASMLVADRHGARTAGTREAGRSGQAADGTAGGTAGAADDDDGRRSPAWSPWSPGAWAPGSGRYTPLGLF